MAQMNIALFAKKSMIETLFLTSLPTELQEKAEKSYDRVENVLISQLTLMCGEGMTKEELFTPIYYDGLDMHHFCGDVHLPEGEKFNEPNLSQIHTPIQFLSGKDDTQVPGFIAREIVQELPNATLISEAGTGHIFFDNKPMVLYNSLEWLLQK
jgi:pimeloyl-ACP methyl ester carboxylesterase